MSTSAPLSSGTRPLLGTVRTSVEAAGADGLLADGVRYGISKVVAGVAGIAGVALFLRLAGTEVYGRFALVFSVTSAAATLCTAWLGHALLRYHEKLVRIPEAGAAVWTGFLISGVAGMTLLATGLLVGGERIDAPLSTSLLAVALFGALSLYQFRSMQFQARLQPGKVVRLTVAQGVLGLALPAIALVAWDRSANALLAGAALAHGAALALATNAHVRIPRARVRRARVERLLASLWSFGWPISLWLACAAMLPVSDRFLLQQHAGFDAAGAYAGIYDVVVRTLSLALMPVVLAAHPRIMNRWNDGRRDAALSLLRKAAAAQLAVFLPIGLAIWILRGPIARWLLPGSDGIAALVLPLLLGAYLWQVAVFAHKPLELKRKTPLMLALAAAALALHACLTWLLLPALGMAAPAYAFVASGAAYVIAALVLASNSFERLRSGPARRPPA